MLGRAAQMMSHLLNMVRSLCRVRARSGGGLAHAMAAVRFSPPQGLAARGAKPGATAGLYRLSYSATAKDFT